MRTHPQEAAEDLVISSDPEEARQLQLYIEAQLRRYHFDEREVFGIRLALEEALVNAIKHGNRQDPTKRVRVRFRVNAHRFEVGVTDEGGGFHPDHVPDPCADENLERPSGRGLFLMRHYMTEVTYHPPGNHLTMARERNRPGEHYPRAHTMSYVNGL